MFNLCKNPLVHTREPDHEGPVVYRVAIIVGHTEKKQGAKNYLGETEFLFNERIANKVQVKLRDMGINCPIVKRDPNANYNGQVKKIASWCAVNAIDLIACLHFNSAAVRARGCEALICASRFTLGQKFADLITDKLNEELGFRERGKDGVVYIDKGDRGHKMLSSIEKVGTSAVIVEPTFANERHKESIAIFENEDSYVDILTKSIAAMAFGHNRYNNSGIKTAKEYSFEVGM